MVKNKIKQHLIEEEDNDYTDVIIKLALEQNDIGKNIDTVMKEIAKAISFDDVNIDDYDKDNFGYKDVEPIFSRAFDLSQAIFSIIALCSIAQSLVEHDDDAKSHYEKSFAINFKRYIKSCPEFLAELLKRFRKEGFMINKELIEKFMENAFEDIGGKKDMEN